MAPEFHRQDQWWVSPFNVADQVRRSFSLPPHPALTTDSAR